MQTNNLGYPRIGSNRELKKASEKYWAGKISVAELIRTGVEIRKSNWELQKEAGIDLIPSNDFSFYDQVLDMALMVSAIPKRYHKVILDKSNSEIDLYFAMARGYQKDGLDIRAMEMTRTQWRGKETSGEISAGVLKGLPTLSIYRDPVETEYRLQVRRPVSRNLVNPD